MEADNEKTNNAEEDVNDDDGSEDGRGSHGRTKKPKTPHVHSSQSHQLPVKLFFDEALGDGPEAGKDYLLSLMFSHFDQNNNGALEYDELHKVCTGTFSIFFHYFLSHLDFLFSYFTLSTTIGLWNDTNQVICSTSGFVFIRYSKQIIL